MYMFGFDFRWMPLGDIVLVGSGRRIFTDGSSLPQITEHEMSEATPSGVLF